MRRRHAAAVVAVPDFQPSEDDVITDVVEYDQPVIDVDDDWLNGKPFDPTPNQAPYAELVQTTCRLIMDEIKQEALRLAQVDKQSMRVSTNLSGSIQFRRYALRAISATQPLEAQVLWEKPFRGNVTIINTHATASVWLSDEPGIRASGQNTIELVGGNTANSRIVIRTREELFALVTESATDVVLQIVEEFDS